MKTASRILLLLFAAALALAAACSRSAFDAQVERAETLMDSAPDSALAIAEALHPGNRAEQARAALLLTKARYKAYVPLTDDSLISMAANYYSGRNDSLETQALFLLGRTLYTKGDFTHALIAANDGARIAQKNKDFMYEAQFHRLTGDVLEQCYDFRRSYFHRLAAAQLFDNAGKASHRNWEILSSIEQLSRLDQVKTAVLKLDSLQRVLPNESDAFKVECHSLMAQLRYKTKEYDKSLEEYQIVENYGISLSSHQLSLIANIYINLDSLEKAELTLSLAENKATSKTDSLILLLNKSQLYAKRGKYKAALNNRIEYESIHDEYRDSLLIHPYNSLLNDYLTTVCYSQEIDLQRKQQIIIFIIAILLLIVIICLLAFYNYRKKNLLKETKIKLKLSELKQNEELVKGKLSELDYQISSLNLDLTKAYSINRNMEADLEYAIQQRIQVINGLCQILSKTKNSSGEIQVYNHKLTNEILKLCQEDSVKTMVWYLDKKYDNVISIIDREYPSITIKNRNFYIFSVLGFSAKAICVILSIESMNSCYVTKNRLIKYFLELKNEHTDEIVSLLSLNKA